MHIKTLFPYLGDCLALSLSLELVLGSDVVVDRRKESMASSSVRYLCPMAFPDKVKGDLTLRQSTNPLQFNIYCS